MLLDGPSGVAPFVTTGRILHVPLAGLATPDLMELRTVLAHELAHAVASGSAAALASSLLRIGIVTRLNDEALCQIAEEPDVAFSNYRANLAEDVLARLAAGQAGDPAAHLGDHAPIPLTAIRRTGSGSKPPAFR